MSAPPARRAFLTAAIDPLLSRMSLWTVVDNSSMTSFALPADADVAELIGGLSDPSPSEPDAAAEPADFATWYRRLNFDYPFLDYAIDQSFVEDRSLMGQYNEIEPRPPLEPPRDGAIYSLSESDSDQPLRDVAAALRVALGYTRIDADPFGQIGFRTSPSGGRRNPTEVRVWLSPGFSTSLGGTWWYDAERHELRGAHSERTVPTAHVGPHAVFYVHSRVERAMWRYRDARALRPVLLDAGHVQQTLRWALGDLGWYTVALPAPGTGPIGDFDDTLLSIVVATAAPATVRIEPAPLADLGDGGRPLAVNPFLSLTALDGRLVAETTWPRSMTVELDSDDAAALMSAAGAAHLHDPGSLGDARPPDAPELGRLVERGLVLGADAEHAWQAARTWSARGWYPSLLMHGQAAATRAAVSGTTERGEGRPSRWRALDQRRTCRQFAGVALTNEAWLRLCDALANVTSVRVAVAALITDASQDPHDLSESSVTTLIPGIDQDAVQAIGAGQPWTRGAAVVLWLLADGPLAGAGQWESTMLDIASVAQTLIAGLVDDDTAVYQTPALIDSLLRRHGVVSADWIDGAYMIAVGRPAIRLSTEEPSFRAADVMRSALAGRERATTVDRSGA